MLLLIPILARLGTSGPKVGEGGQGGDEVRHLPRSLPKVRRAQVGGMGGAVEEVRHRVVGGAALGILIIIFG